MYSTAFMHFVLYIRSATPLYYVIYSLRHRLPIGRDETQLQNHATTQYFRYIWCFYGVCSRTVAVLAWATKRLSSVRKLDSKGRRVWLKGNLNPYLVNIGVCYTQAEHDSAYSRDYYKDMQRNKTDCSNFIFRNIGPVIYRFNEMFLMKIL